MSTAKKILVSLMATSFLGATLVPALAQPGTPGKKPVAEKRMAHAGAGKHGKRQRGSMKRAFERYDVNKDGVITQEEVDTVIVDRFNTFSGDDNAISLEDFRAAWIDQSSDRMVRAFQRLDRDGNGAITAEEYNSVSDRMFNRLDRDGNGELTRPAKSDKAKAGGKQGKKGKMAKRGGPRHGQGAARLMERFDTDKDGKITRAEFDAVRAEIFGGADANNNQAVSLEEFATIWQGMNDNRIVRGFQRYDTDGDLSITLEEYTAGNAGFVKKHDRNGDGVVTKADRKGGKHDGKRSGKHMKKKGKDRASMQKPMKPVQPIQPDKKA